MEYLDIFDESGNSLGVKKTKSEAHSQGLWHKNAHVWIINSKKEVLLQKRSLIVENHPDLWDISAAGHVSSGQDIIYTALRETEEEIGLKLDPSQLIPIGIIKEMSRVGDYINNEFNSIFVVRMDLDPEKIEKQEEVSEVKFISYKILKEIVESGDKTFVPHPQEYQLLFNYLDKN